jgi:predicted outer membrane repeat protein
MSDGSHQAAERGTPQFLDLKSYRRKRIIDAAKLLPVIGAVGLFFPPPFLFLGDSSRESGGAIEVALFFFGGWIVLIVVALLLSRALTKTATGD